MLVAPPPQPPAPGGDDDGVLKKSRPRQNFTWHQLSILEQVFETDPLPWPVNCARH